MELNKEVEVTLEPVNEYLVGDELKLGSAFEVLWAYQCVKHFKTSAVFLEDVIIVHRNDLESTAKLLGV